MTPSLRTSRPLAAGVVAGLLAAVALVATGPGAGPADARQAGAGYQEPTVGSCHGYSAKQLRRPTDNRPEVPCTGPHTARTIAVLRVKGSPEAENVFGRYGPRCYRAMTRSLGGNQAQIVSTAYGISFFRPSNKQIRKGARWLRCDVVLAGGNRLQPLSSPLLTDPASDTVARCAIGTQVRPTVCSRKHSYRATGTVTGRRGAYPGESGFARIAFAKCPDKVSSPRTSRLYFPPAEQWRSGFRTLACLSKTSS